MKQQEEGSDAINAELTVTNKFRYRITEWVSSITGRSIFYIEKRHSFLWIRWWSCITEYNAEFDTTFKLSYDSIASAKKAINLYNDKWVKIIHINW